MRCVLGIQTANNKHLPQQGSVLKVMDNVGSKDTGRPRGQRSGGRARSRTEYRSVRTGTAKYCLGGLKSDRIVSPCSSGG